MTRRFRVKRVYQPPEPADGNRVLVDRLWPRDLSRAAARIDLWCRELAPSDALRRRFHAEPSLWDAFRAAYHAELARPDAPIAQVPVCRGTFAAKIRGHHCLAACRSHAAKQPNSGLVPVSGTSDRT